jgi:hypothetical protein
MNFERMIEAVNALKMPGKEVDHQARALEEIGDLLKIKNARKRKTAIGMLGISLMLCARSSTETIDTHVADHPVTRDDLQYIAKNVVMRKYNVCVQFLANYAKFYNYDLMDCLQLVTSRIYCDYNHKMATMLENMQIERLLNGRGCVMNLYGTKKLNELVERGEIECAVFEDDENPISKAEADEKYIFVSRGTIKEFIE